MRLPNCASLLYLCTTAILNRFLVSISLLHRLLVGNTFLNAFNQSFPKGMLTDTLPIILRGQKYQTRTRSSTLLAIHVVNSNHRAYHLHRPSQANDLECASLLRERRTFRYWNYDFSTSAFQISSN